MIIDMVWILGAWTAASIGLPFLIGAGLKRLGAPDADAERTHRAERLADARSRYRRAA